MSKPIVQTSEIQAWINDPNRDYNVGVLLFARISNNRSLLGYFQRSKTQYSIDKLIYEFEKYLKTVPVAQQETISEIDKDSLPKQPEQLINPAPKVEPTNVQADITNLEYLAVVAQKDELYTIRCQLSNSLIKCSTDEERKMVVDKIDEVQDKYNQLAEVQEYYEKHGTMPEEPQAEQEQAKELTEAELLKLKESLAQKRSKLRKKLEAKPDNVKWQEELAKTEIEYRETVAKLKLMKEAKAE